MAISKFDNDYFINALTSQAAGLELISALENGSVLSTFTLDRLIIALGSQQAALNLQAAMINKGILSAEDIQYMSQGFANAQVAQDAVAAIASSNAVSNAITAPSLVGMPITYGLEVANSGVTQAQIVSLSAPAGSSFPTTGTAGYVELYNGGDANKYYVWYSVLGGSVVDPAPAGFTGIEVIINASDTAAAVATKTLTAIAAGTVALSTSVSGSVVSITATVVLVATPTFSLPAGTYSGTQFVTLSCSTAGASMFYTLDGSSPTISSTPYVTAISVGASETIKVLATKSGLANSAIASAAYVITGSAGVATHLVFSTQPSAGVAGVAFPTQPIVTIKDASGATVTTGADATASITLSLLSGTGVLSGTVTMAAVAGVADFVGKGVKINLYGNKTLLATKADTTGGGGTVSFTIASDTFNIANSLATVDLGTSANYKILAESGISTTAGSFITGAIAVSPIASTAITGFGLILDGSGTFSTSSLVSGHVFAADYASPTPATLTTAISDMGTAYTDAAGRPTPDFTNLGSGNLGGLTLTPGLYKWTSGVTIPTNVTISGGPNDIFIFQIAGTLVMSASTSIILSGGVVASNIFWQVAGAVTIGANAVFSGIVLAQTSVALVTSASLSGRILAQTAATLQSNAIT